MSKEKVIFALLEIPYYLKEVKVENWDRRGYNNKVLIGVYENIDLITGVQYLEFNQVESLSSYEYSVIYKVSLFNNGEVAKNTSGYRKNLSVITD